MFVHLRGVYSTSQFSYGLITVDPICTCMYYTYLYVMYVLYVLVCTLVSDLTTSCPRQTDRTYDETALSEILP